MSLESLENYLKNKKKLRDYNLPDADVKSLSDIKAVIKPFLPKNDDSRTVTISSNTNDMQTISGDKIANNSIVSAKVSQLSPRGLLLEGLEIVNKQSKVPHIDFESVKEEFGGYIPAEILAGQHKAWVDWLIKKKLGGKRHGMKIYWDLDKRYVFDPVTGELS